MTMKKNVLALAVSGGLIAAPMAAVAEPEIYGLIDIGVETLNDTDNASGGEIFSGFNSPSGDNASGRGFLGGKSSDKDFQLSNGMQSRIGVRGSEDLGWGGLEASYNIELGVDVLNESGGATDAPGVSTRLGWAALGGDWGKVKVGSQWQALYEFGGWNTHRTDVHGYGSYFYTTGVLNDAESGNGTGSVGYGFRQSSAISYQYGSAWGHSDPFAFNVTLGIGEGERAFNPNTDTTDTETVTNQEGISSVQVAGQYSIDQRISVNAVYVREFNDYDLSGIQGQGIVNNEVELMNLGARWSVTDALELGVNYTEVDTDNADGDTRDSLAIASFMDFGEGLTGHLGLANGSDDRDKTTFRGRDIDLNAYGFVKQALSDRTNIRFEFEHVKYDGYLDDADATLGMVALQHNF